jgi:hypothetical protein
VEGIGEWEGVKEEGLEGWFGKDDVPAPWDAENLKGNVCVYIGKMALE